MAMTFFLISFIIGGSAAWFAARKFPSIWGLGLAIVASVVGAYLGLHVAAALVRNSDSYRELVHVVGETGAETLMSAVATKSLLYAAAAAVVSAFFVRRVS